MTTSIQHFFHRERNVIILMLILGFICYGNIFQNGYSLDDQYIFTENVLASNGLENFIEIFTKPSLRYDKTTFGYRPITILSFAIESQFFGINPVVSHSISLLLYLLSCSILYLLLKKIFPEESRWLAMFTAIFFLIHPIHTELVNNVKSRDELLMLLFGLMATLYWIKIEKKWIFKPLAILFLLLSIFSKKSGLIFIGILPLATFFVSKGNWKRSITSFGVMGVPFVLWKLIKRGYDRDIAERHFLSIENPLFGEEIPHEKGVIVLESIWFYTKALVFPIRFSAYYGFSTLNVEDFQFVSFVGLLFLVFISILAIYKLGKTRPVSFGAILLLGALMPYINLFKPMTGIVAERFTNISSIGWSIVVCYGAYTLFGHFKVQKLQPISLALLTLFFLSSTIIIRDRNQEWKSEKSVLEAGLKEYPYSVIMNKTLGGLYHKELKNLRESKARTKKINQIIKVNENAVEKYPEKVAFTNIGNMQYQLVQNLPAALQAYKKAIAIDPNFIHALSGLGHVYRDLGQYQEAIQYFEQLLKVSPKQKGIYEKLIGMLLSQNSIKSANQWNRTAIKHFPNDPKFVAFQKQINQKLNLVKY